MAERKGSKGVERGRVSGAEARRLEQRARVLELRAGPRIPFDAIAREVGVSKSTAFRLYREALDEAHDRLVETAERHVVEMLEVYDRLIRSHWATRTNPQSAGVIMRCLDSKRKLLGLDQPARVEHSGEVTVGHVVEDREERLKRIMAEEAESIAAMSTDEILRELGHA